MDTRSGNKNSRIIALVANQNEIFFRLRMPWVRFLLEQGYKVHAVVPDGVWTDQIKESGAIFHDWKLSRSGRNPFNEFFSVFGLAMILRRIRPDIVQNFHTKPNIYAPIATKLAGSPVTVSTVTGLGYTFVERTGLKSKFARRFNLLLYSIANRLASEIAFQNPDDLNMLREANCLPGEKGRLLAGGSGVDISEYSPFSQNSEKSLELRKTLGISPDTFVALFLGRLQLDKGLEDFVEAARISNRDNKNISWVMVGAPDPGNLRSVTENVLEMWKNEGNVIFPGRREDVPAIMAASNVVITPTFYREGIPRTLLEASATGLPLIGTDMPGVREVITNGENGYLVPLHSPERIAGAVEELAVDPTKAERFGRVSLKRARDIYDHTKVLSSYVEMYEGLLKQPCE